MSKAINEVVVHIFNKNNFCNIDIRSEMIKFIEHLTPIMTPDRIYKEIEIAIEEASKKWGLENHYKFTENEVEEIWNKKGSKFMRENDRVPEYDW